MAIPWEEGVPYLDMVPIEPLQHNSTAAVTLSQEFVETVRFMIENSSNLWLHPGESSWCKMCRSS